MKKTISRLKDILKPHIKTVILVSIFAIIIDIIEIVKPYITKIVIFRDFPRDIKLFKA